MNKLLRSPHFWVIFIMILLAALTRVLNHPPNMAPIAAIALFGAVYFKKRAHAFILPIIALLCSDILLEVTYNAGIQPNKGFYGLSGLIYITFIGIVLIGFLLNKKFNVLTLIPATLGGSVLFFIVTNFGVWVLDPIAYTRDFSGIIRCYTLAIPFFKNTLIGDMAYVTLLFGSYELIIKRIPALVRV